jgi:hypothetical protein
MKIKVKQHNLGGDNNDHIESVNLVHLGDDVIILDINLRTKYKQVSGFGGASESGWQSLWVGNDEVLMQLPERFSDNHIFAEGSRYNISVCIYRYELLETMTESKYEDVVLWESPE